MNRILLFFLFISVFNSFAQTTTNSNGNGSFDNPSTWSSPVNLTGTANILNNHNITIRINNTVYADKVNFNGSGKLILTGTTSRWLPATNLNANPHTESYSIAENWSASSVWANVAFNVECYNPWIDSSQSWCAGSANNGTDFLQYDLRTPRWIQGIVTQGRASVDQWVTNAKIDVSLDNTNWVTIYSNRPLNTDRNTKVFINFPRVMLARYVRVTPINVVNHASMRLGVLLRDYVFRSCNEIKQNNPNATDGYYSIDPGGSSGSLPVTPCYCDMTTNGGGWTLVLNYLHRGGTNPAVAARSYLPLLGSTVLGTDESASTVTWGHTSPSYLNSFTFTELRFFARTSAHNRVIHFKTTHAPSISYFKTGSGGISGINTNFTALSGHTAFIPANAVDTYPNQGNLAMTNFPFWLGGAYHWGIAGTGNRWEVDDFPANFANNTYHQIWIR